MKILIIFIPMNDSNFTFKSEDLEMINDVIDADFIVNVENDDDIWKYKDINETDFIRVSEFEVIIGI